LLSDDDREKDAKESRGGRPHRLAQLDHGTLEEFGIGIKRYLCEWSGADVDEIARLCVDLVAAFIEPPTPALTPEAATDPSCGSLRIDAGRANAKRSLAEWRRSLADQRHSLTDRRCWAPTGLRRQTKTWSVWDPCSTPVRRSMWR